MQSRTIFLLALLCVFGNAQDVAPVFEVASVKVNSSRPEAANGFFASPGPFKARNTTLQQLVQAAYHINTGHLFGITPWMESGRFDIDAKSAGNSNFEEDFVMLRGLLADRFQLRFHREVRQLSTQALVIAKGGLKLHASKDQDQNERVKIGATEISGFAIPFGHFVSVLAAQLGSPVINETGLSGKYDIALRYSRDDIPDNGSPSIFAALDELGLKLESNKGPVEVFVIDSAARPGEN